MSWHWYLSSALPRSLLSSFLLLPFGFWLEPRVRLYAGIALLYIAMYSFLPHKEVRALTHMTQTAHQNPAAPSRAPVHQSQTSGLLI